MRLTKEHIGCTVRRVSGTYQHGIDTLKMTRGDIDTVVDVLSNAVTLEKYGKGHSPTAFELVTEPNIKPENIRDIRMVKGDKVQLLESYLGVAKGSTARIKEDLGDIVTLQSYGGRFPKDALKALKASTDTLISTSLAAYDTYEEGDYALLVDYGWGVGSSSDAVGTLVKIIECRGERYAVHVFPGTAKEQRYGCVNPKCLRKVTKATKVPAKSMTVSEGPEVKSKFAKKGVVTGFLGLSTPITVIEQQTHANRVVRELARKHTGTISVCGGAPRNWQFNKPANDIDVYLYIRGANAEVIQGTLARYLGLESRHVVRLGTGSAYYAQNNVEFVYEVKLAGQKYQFIVTQGPIKDVEKDVLEFFNCDICKIAWDALNDTYHVTLEFKTDRDFKRLTYRMYALDKRNAELSMDKHVPKMMKQFPEFDVYIMRNPEHKVDDDGEF